MTTFASRNADARSTLAAAAVTHLDDTARYVSATCWASSREVNANAFELLESLLEITKTDCVDLKRTASIRPGEVFDHLRTRLSGIPNDDRMFSVASTVEDETRLIFHRSAAGIEMSTPEGAGAAVDVVIPFRSNHATPLRTRNLQTVVTALSRQNFDRDRLRITVVEEDSQSAVPSHLLERIDRHIRISYDGPFNKALAINRAVESVDDDAMLCLLDGDIYPDPSFVGRNADRVARFPNDTHLPYSDMFCLLAADSESISAGQEASHAAREGYLITHPPGGCVWLSSTTFRKANGFDESFLGWGGEDRDFINRAAVVSKIRRHSELLVHLYHERPAMPEDREIIMNRAARTASREQD